MGNNNNKKNGSRRWFMSMLLSGNGVKSLDHPNSDKVKMLTADGKLVEIDRSALEKATRKEKATNARVYEWMDNPSKKNEG